MLELDLSMLIRRSPEAKVETDRKDEGRGRCSGVPNWKEGARRLDCFPNSVVSMDDLVTDALLGLIKSVWVDSN